MLSQILRTSISSRFTEKFSPQEQHCRSVSINTSSACYCEQCLEVSGITLIHPVNQVAPCHEAIIHENKLSNNEKYRKKIIKYGGIAHHKYSYAKLKIFETLLLDVTNKCKNFPNLKCFMLLLFLYLCKKYRIVFFPSIKNSFSKRC